MRIFGSDRIAKLMDRMGLEEGEVIQHSMMTKSIERAHIFSICNFVTSYYSNRIKNSFYIHWPEIVIKL